MQYTWDFEIVLRHVSVLMTGLVGTLKLTGVALLFGMLLGLCAALIRLSRIRTLRVPVSAYIELFRSTPGMVQLFWIFYALPILIGLNFEPFHAAVLTLSCQSSAFFAEIFRGGILSIERGQWEAGRALGMDRFTLMRRIILPQAVRRMIPPFANQTIQLFKMTPIVAVIAYPDLLYQAMHLSHELYRPLEIYTIVAGIYVIILCSGSQMVRLLEQRLSRSER